LLSCFTTNETAASFDILAANGRAEIVKAVICFSPQTISVNSIGLFSVEKKVQFTQACHFVANQTPLLAAGDHMGNLWVFDYATK